MKELLIKLNACDPAMEWVGDKSWPEIYATCHRGDWLLWLFKRTNPDDLQLLTLAKGHCANTVRHLMKDERSIKAVDAAIAFGNGKISMGELAAAAAAAAAVAAYVAADAAYAAAVAAAAAAAAYAAYAAYAADAAAVAAAYAAYAAAAYAAAAYAYAYAAADAYDAYAAARKESGQLTADVVRQYIPIDKWNVNI